MARGEGGLVAGTVTGTVAATVAGTVTLVVVGADSYLQLRLCTEADLRRALPPVFVLGQYKHEPLLKMAIAPRMQTVWPLTRLLML